MEINISISQSHIRALKTAGRDFLNDTHCQPGRGGPEQCAQRAELLVWSLLSPSNITGAWT